MKTKLESGYFENVVSSKNWDELINLAADPANTDNVSNFFSDIERTISTIKDMTDAQITRLISVQQYKIISFVVEGISRVCDEDPRFSKICANIIKKRKFFFQQE